MLTHRNLVASLSQMRDAHGVTSSDTVLASLPLVHTFGLQVTLNLSLRAGACVVLMPRFEIEGFLDTIQRHDATRAEIFPRSSRRWPTLTCSTTTTSRACT